MSADEMDELKNKVDEIHKALLGDFEKEGLVRRVDTLEKKQKFFINVIYGVIATLFTVTMQLLFGV
jgi:tetrahydromethanopterin S-methyltransferase subunit G